MSDELREQIVRALHGVMEAVASPIGRLSVNRLADAVMAVVGPLVAAEAKFDERLSDLQAEYVKREQAWDRTRELLTRERDQARQVARQANNNCADFAEVLGLPRDAYWDEMITAIDRLRWLHAEAVWQRNEARERADKRLVKYVAVADELDAQKALRASAVQLPESWVGNLWNALATRIDDLDNLNDAYEAIKLLIESWRPATERNEGH